MSPDTFTRREHGGPDARGAAAFDFSTNANACGPCPPALAAVQRADAGRYPDPHYTALREKLAARHAVAPGRIVMAASASDCIFRLTAYAAQRGLRRVSVPAHGYGDYTHAAQAWELAVAVRDEDTPVFTRMAALAWACDPASPTGEDDPPPFPAPAMTALDCAYAPLRLSGRSVWYGAPRDRAWQLWSPNKALGLTGIRAAYAIAPQGAEDEARALERLAPSWPIGAHGVALLEAWCGAATADWLAESLEQLRGWKTRQRVLCDTMGWDCAAGHANFYCARPPLPAGMRLAELLAALRAQGVALRDAASFGLAHTVRLSVQPPAAQDALRRAWAAATAPAQAARRAR
ncbi:MAG: aminotransferase class I/II-fold pyridoxal phosphate-dependent enzyme [Pseudomonadota bacterium]